MLYMFLSFIFCGLAIPCFEYDRTALGVFLIVLSTLMPVIKDIREERIKPPPPIVIEPDPAVEARFNSIISKLDELEKSLNRCSEILDVPLSPAQ